jgi:hypothetical protein
MDRPLWRIVLAIVLLAFGLERGALAFAASGSGPDAAVLCLALEAAAGVAAALGVFLAAAWAPASLIGLGVVLAATALLEAFAWGIRPPLAAIGQVVATGIGCGVLAVLVSRDSGARDAPTDPVRAQK